MTDPVETPLIWAENLAKDIDIGGNTILLCDPKVETFSRRAGLARNAGKRWGCVVCKVLDWAFGLIGHPHHCDDAVAAGEVE